MKYFFTYLLIFFPLSSFAQRNYSLIINGGIDKKNNSQRYFENVRSIYEAFRSSTPADHISVLYGSGKVEDTNAFMSTENSFTLEKLFHGDKKNLDGPANKNSIAQQIKELSQKLKTGDAITLFITDHGQLNSQGETSINLWGENLTVRQLKDILTVIPKKNQIKIVTNICFGGGLTELTSSNTCVLANQQKDRPSQSENHHVDLYAQNFAKAFKNKKNIWQAHAQAIELDSVKNNPVTSLDWFLLKYKSLNKKKSTDCPNCLKHPEMAINQISSLIQEINQSKGNLPLPTAGISQKRQKFLNNRINSMIKNYSPQMLESINAKIKKLKNEIALSAKNWDLLSPEKQQKLSGQMLKEATKIKTQLEIFEKKYRQYEILAIELDFLKNGSDQLIEEYAAIRSCLEDHY